MQALTFGATVALAGAAGLISGTAACFTTRLLMAARCKEPYSAWYITKPFTPFLWAAVFAAMYAASAAYLGGWREALPLMLMLFPLAAISACDAKIRKIPNPMLIVLFIEMVLLTALGWPELLIGERLIAAVVGLIVFMVPSLLKLSVGWGDVKLAVVLALIFRMFSFFQIIAIMGIGFAVAAVMLYATKKGNIKTSLPMGPFLALGAVITAVFPMF